jgi:hypothetical protein
VNDTIQAFANEIAFNSFTAAQMRVMLCAVVENMTESQAAALLDTIGMELSDVI